MKFLQIRISNFEEAKTAIFDNLERSRHKISAVIHSLQCVPCNDKQSAIKLLERAKDEIDDAWKSLMII